VAQVSVANSSPLSNLEENKFENALEGVFQMEVEFSGDGLQL